MRTYLFLALFLLSTSFANSQTWSRQYFPNWAPDLAGTAYTYDSIDGGLLAGDVPYQDCYLVRFNANGDTLWTKIDPLDTCTLINIKNIIKLTGGDYVVLSSRYGQNGMIEVVQRYSSTGILLYDTSMSYINGYTVPLNGPQIFSGDNNSYYFIYQRDTGYYHYDQNNNLVAAGILSSYIRKFDGNNDVVASYTFEFPYDGLSQTWYANTTIITQSVCTIGNGLILVKHYDTLNPPYEAFGNSVLERIDAAGNVMWDVDLHTELGLPQSVGIRVMNSFVTSDSSIILSAWKSDQMSTTQVDGSVLIKFNANGNLVNYVAMPTWQFAYIGCELQNGDILFSGGTFDTAISSSYQGFIRYDHNLNFISYSPEPLSEPLTNIVSLIPNKYGGAFLAYRSMIGNHIYAVNFDSLYNTYPAQVSGNIYLDMNQDCQPNTGDHNILYSPVKLTDANSNDFFAFSNSNGMYNADVPLGNYSVSHPITSLNKQALCPVGGYNFNFVSAGLNVGADFYDGYIPGLNNLSVEFYPGIFVPGFTGNVALSVCNVGSISVGGTLTVVLDNNVTYNSAAPAPASVLGNVLTFNIAALDPDSSQHISISVNVSQSQLLGSTLTFSADVANTGDIDLNNNTDVLTSTVVGSFDPNDKSVNRPLINAPNDELVYKVRFQNTGTYFARNVVVVDTLSSLLDLSTFRLISASPMIPEVAWGTGNKLTFNFAGIYLPDSNTNEPASHGEFIYGIRPKNNVPLGDTVCNTAYIYFDFNAPVITNTTINVMGWPTSVPIVGKVLNTVIYPNPSNGTFTVLLPGKDKWEIRVSNAIGETVKYGLYSGGFALLDIKASSGIYFVTISNSDTKEIVIKKLIIQ